MATAVSNGSHSAIGHGADSGGASPMEDPFTAGHVTQNPHSHRYSAFDTQLFSLNASSSPGQVRRTLEAHIAETDRRLGDASKLGTTLLDQRKELQEKLQEIEKQQDDAELTPELRQRLMELEREYNEVGRDSARAILAPRSRVVSAEEGQTPSGAATYSSQATASPTKVSVPTRKQRNQTSSRVGDIQFAADISTSLLAQVRQLQAVLAERDDAVKAIALEKSRLELEAEGFSQRLRALDESEQRYKDENWNLETQTHELIASVKDSADREKKLNAGLIAALAEKTRANNELDELRLVHGKLSDDHSTAQKTHDAELHSLRRTVDLGDAEKLSLQNRIEELTSQNQELAKAVATRFRSQENEGQQDYGVDDEDFSRDMSTPEGSPPPSPTKGTPRHPGLESETLKSSLHHAHRMIQNLKGNIHREKTEKIELKRMLQEARNELELAREAGPGSGAKRQKTKSDTFKKPLHPSMLGAGRKDRTDIEIEDPDWQDHDGEGTPSRSAAVRHQQPGAWPGSVPTTDLSDAYQTANETEAFETANERETATESEAFQTGAESMAGDSTDELTETEETSTRGGTIRGKRPAPIMSSRMSFQSTASTSAGEEEDDVQTPVQTQPQKYRLRLSKFLGSRRSRTSMGSASAQSSAKNSPASFQDRSPPVQGQQSLFAELGESSPASFQDRSPPVAGQQSLFAELGEAGSDGEFSTPGRSSVVSPKSTPGGLPDAVSQNSIVTSRFSQPVPPEPMVDSGMMTEPWEPTPIKQQDQAFLVPMPGALDASPSARSSVYSTASNVSNAPMASDFPLPPSHPGSPGVVDSGTQWTPHKSLNDSPTRGLPSFITPPKTVWDEEQEEPSTPVPAPAPVVLGLSQLSTLETHPVVPQPLEMPLAYSGIAAQHTTPIEAQVPVPEPVHTPVAVSPPVQEARAETPEQTFTPLAYSTISAIETTPVETPVPEPIVAPVVAKDEQSRTAESPEDARPSTAKRAGIVGAGMLGSLGAAFGLNRATEQEQPQSADDYFTQEGKDTQSHEIATRSPLQDISANAAPSPVTKKVNMSDQGAQTLLTSSQIDKALMQKITSPASTIVPKAPLSASTWSEPPRLTSPPPESPRTPSRGRTLTSDSQNAPVQKSPAAGITPRRPSSSSSVRQNGTAGHPPLPPDHKQVIVAAGGKLPTEAKTERQVMGPPLAPASAYKRPRTPGEHAAGSPSKTGTTPRPRERPGVTSQLSRRSSVTSFASELDERFNIHANGYPGAHAFEPGTDPRMIQAITQTMIGEFLWKYTRKAGRGEMSNTRHRRYFWVHPYTKTLYWSDQDPQTAGRNELKAKSVAIEAVRVVTDDNPMPPGLHRKSLEVITPGRKVKFTASTSQRHETWFNALSYLLMRNSDDGNINGALSDAAQLTAEDVDEFNPGGRSHAASRASLSSYNSRTTQNTAIRTSSRLSNRQQAGESSSSRPTLAVPPGQQSARKGSMSRLSNMFRGSIGYGRSRSDGFAVGAMSPGEEGSNDIYNASLVEDKHDSAEDLRREMLQQEKEADRLENVRACCDGKHDVSTLTRGGRHSHKHHSHSLNRR